LHASPELERDRKDDSEENKTYIENKCTIERESEGKTTDRGTKIHKNKKRARRTLVEDRETHRINGEGNEINTKENMSD